ncbi:MAG: FHA domain-containing protein [Proteobacteria bacterium]|nr:FHA domain-containing protein [Pseudomonadota bacterium]
MTDNFQSGKTQAIDLDELHVDSANRPSEYKVRGEFELDKWGDDPWNSTEESRKRRRWAEDDRWYGDDEEKKNQNESMWDADEEALKAGWHAPKRGDVLVTSEGWDDWDNFGGAPKELEQEQESKDFGGYRRIQAASQYAQVDTSNYVDGRAQRDDLYRSKEVFGTSGVKERKGDPYADIMMQQRNVPMPEMKPVSEWNDESPAAEKKEKEEEEDMRASAKISNLAQSSGDDIPGVTRASIIIFQADTEPVVYELKKIVTSIGRGLDNMVILNDQYASRKHLSINYVGGRFELAGLSVDNIASVNGYPITRVMLKNEDQIEVGATRIKFVVGPISEAHMTLRAPKNGKPIHLVPPPREVRSPKTTKKNLILLIAVVGVIVFFVVAMLVFMLLKKDNSVSDAPVANAETEAQEDEKEAETPPEQSLPPLQQSDKNIVEGMMEAYSLGTGHYVSTAGSVMGDKIRIKITSEPEGARIYNQDGSLRGKTPYEYDEHVTGDREEDWTIRLDGYAEQIIKVKLNAAVNEDIKLVSEAPAKPEPPKPAAKPKPKAKPKGGAKKKPAKKGGSGSSGRIMI